MRSRRFAEIVPARPPRVRPSRATNRGGASPTAKARITSVKPASLMPPLEMMSGMVEHHRLARSSERLIAVAPQPPTNSSPSHPPRLCTISGSVVCKGRVEGFGTTDFLDVFGGFFAHDVDDVVDRHDALHASAASTIGGHRSCSAKRFERFGPCHPVPPTSVVITSRTRVSDCAARDREGHDAGRR